MRLRFKLQLTAEQRAETVAFGQIPVSESNVGDSENNLGEIDAWLDAKKIDDQETEATAEKMSDQNPDRVLSY